VVDIEDAITIEKGGRPGRVGFFGRAHRNFDRLHVAGIGNNRRKPIKLEGSAH
jgi:hypothetical protein